MTKENPLSQVDIAKAVAQTVYQKDLSSQHLGIALKDIGPGFATMTMRVSDFMMNGHNICHGGYIFTLADTALFGAHLAGAQAVSLSYVEDAAAADMTIEDDFSGLGQNTLGVSANFEEAEPVPFEHEQAGEVEPIVQRDEETVILGASGIFEPETMSLEELGATPVAPEEGPPKEDEDEILDTAFADLID